MSALAKMLKDNGKTVCGYDICGSVYTEELRTLGIGVSVGEKRESVKDFDAVVYTDAVSDIDPQLMEARDLGKMIFSRGQLLYELSKNFKKVIAISGCHGKTTCTAMVAHIFEAANKKFCAHIGGRDLKFANYCRTGYDYFITEACEYKKNFLLLKPDIAAVLNSRPDHIECYGSPENLKKCYSDFLYTAETGIAVAGDGFGDCLTFGFGKSSDYCARKIKQQDGKFCFSVYEGGCYLGRLSLRVYGRHNILNALAAVAVARCVLIPFKDIRAGIESFTGVERRFEKLGERGGAVWIADYAHHPDEIKATIKAVKCLDFKNIYVVFQPHTYSRTKILFKQFFSALSGIKHLMIFRTYAAREYYDDAGSAITLSRRLQRSGYGETPSDIVNFVAAAGKGDVVLFLGAGDIYDIAKNIYSDTAPVKDEN